MLTTLHQLLNKTRSLDFLAPLAMRLYLAPVFWMAGMNKFNGFENTVAWFEMGLKLPMPELMAFLATGTEIAGGIMLLLGLGVRWISIPLMVTMAVAIFSVHLKNGWQAVADPMSCLFNCDSIGGAIDRLSAAKSLLQEHGNYGWLTESGNFVISNNGIEWATTYFIMLLVLFFIGAGKYLSVDHWLCRTYCNK